MMVDYKNLLKGYNKTELIEMLEELELRYLKTIPGHKLLYESGDYFDPDFLYEEGYTNEGGDIINKKADKDKEKLVEMYLESFEGYKMDYSEEQLVIEVASQLKDLDKNEPSWTADVENYPRLKNLAIGLYSNVKPISRKRLFTRRGGWYKEPVNHGFAAKGVKVGRSRVKR